MPYRPIRRREDIPQRPDVGMAAIPQPVWTNQFPQPTPQPVWTNQFPQPGRGLRRQPRQVLTKPKAPGYSLRHDFQRGGLKEVAKGLGNIWTEASKPFLQGPVGRYVSGEAFTPEYKQYQTDARSAQTKLQAATGRAYIPPAAVPAAMRQAGLTPSEMTAAYRAQEELERMGLAAARAAGVTRNMTLPQLMDMAQERNEALLQRGQRGTQEPTGLHSASAVSRAHPTLGPFRPYGWLHLIPHSRIPFANWLDSWTSTRQLGPGEQIDPKREVMGAPGQVIRFQPKAWEHEIPLEIQKFMSPGTEEQHALRLKGVDSLVDRANQLLAEPDYVSPDPADPLEFLLPQGFRDMQERHATDKMRRTIDQLEKDIIRIFGSQISKWKPFLGAGANHLANLFRSYQWHPTPANAKGLLETVRDDLVKAQQFALQRIPEPEPIRNIPIEELITTGLEGSPYGQYFKPGEEPRHPMNEVIANYGMPRIPAGWPPGYEAFYQAVRYNLGRQDQFEQTRQSAWRRHLRENPGALSVPSTQRVAGVYGPPIRTRSNYYKYIGLPPDARSWREIAEELGVPFIETGK